MPAPMQGSPLQPQPQPQRAPQAPYVPLLYPVSHLYTPTGTAAPVVPVLKAESVAAESAIVTTSSTTIDSAPGVAKNDLS